MRFVAITVYTADVLVELGLWFQFHSSQSSGVHEAFCCGTLFKGTAS